MSIAVLSGFAVLALASGFFLTGRVSSSIRDKVFNMGSSSSGSSSIFDSVNDSYVSSSGSLGNSSITSAPFSETCPDYTGASYFGSGWYLMANGRYFNKSTLEWSDKKPDITPDDDKKGSAILGTAAGVAGSAVTTAISTKSKAYLLVLGAVVAVAVYKLTDGKKKGF